MAERRNYPKTAVSNNERSKKARGEIKLLPGDFVILSEGEWTVTTINNDPLVQSFPLEANERSLLSVVDPTVYEEFRGYNILTYEIYLQTLIRNNRKTDQNKETYRGQKMKHTISAIPGSFFYPENDRVKILRKQFRVIAIGSFSRKKKTMNMSSSEFGVYENNLRQEGFYMLLNEEHDDGFLTHHTWVPGALCAKIIKNNEVL